MGIHFARMLPGELEGDVNPEDYGFDVDETETLSPEEARKRIGALYAQAKARTGRVIPELEPYLAEDTKSDTTDPS